MEGGGIENPVFEPPSPDAGRQRRGSSAKVDAGIPEQFGEGPCGWGCFAPRALQVCNNPEGFLAMYSLLAIFQGMVVNGLINISISTIEKRYELNSSLTGLISASYDISFCILALFVSFFGERGHKPRWLAFSAFMLGLGSLIFSLPHFSSGKYHFGTKLEGTAKIQSEKISETHDDGSELLVEAQNIGKSFKDFPVALLILLKNPVLVSLIIASTSEALVATGFATFLPKLIENQFGKTSSFSATLAGLVLIPAAALGQVVSGILVSKCKMDCKSIIKFMIGTCSVALLLNTVFLFAKCGNEPFAGVSETYNGTGMLHNLTAPCNANCGCSRSMYYPVCGRDEVQYFSPCFAGCASLVINKMKKMYHNCSCIGKPERQTGLEDLFYEAVSGKCPTQCKLLPLFLTFFFFAVVFTFMAVTPTTVAILRCVPDKQRSFALGVQLVFLRLLGTIPGPILFGVAIDNSCTLWDINDCNTKGACWVYDNERMAYLLMGISNCNKDSSVLCIQVLFAKSSQSSSQSWQYVCISLPQPVQSSHERIQKWYQPYTHKLGANGTFQKQPTRTTLVLKFVYLNEI
ncbi:solute carrier organic anion transporter family member 4C1 isoform 1-T1 [Ara ararauna]